MSTTAEYANDVVDRIEAGELDPADVDLSPFFTDDLTAMTPELFEKLPEAKKQAYNERKAKQRERDLDAELADVAADHQEAANTLIDAITDQTSTATVTLGEAELTVTDRLSGPIEQQIEGLMDADSMEEHTGTLISVLTALIHEPEDYTDPDVWWAAYREGGTAFLLEALEVVTDPAKERMEGVRSFR